MIPIYLKTLAELSLVGIPLCIGAVFLGRSTEFIAYQFDVFAFPAGLGLGLVHGLLTHRRRDDLFLAHRPVSPIRMYLAEALAAGTICLAASVVLVATARARWASFLDALHEHGQWALPGGVEWPEIIFMTAVALAGWSACWLALGARRLVWGVVSLCVLVAAMLEWARFVATDAVALGTVFVAVVLMTGVRILGLAQGRA